MENNAPQTNSANGASNAEDFQPQTRNPQTAPGQLFPQTGDLQSTGSGELLTNDQARISVPSSTDSNQTQVAEAKSAADVWVIALVCAAIIVVVLSWWRHRKQSNNRTKVASTPTPISSQEPTKEVSAPSQRTSMPVASKPKKPAPKKSKSQRKKRGKR